MELTPKDTTETKALGLGQRISVALGIVIAALGTLLGAVGGLDWITAHLSLLGTGLGALVTGGITSYVAIRRMRVDKLAKSVAPLVAFILLPLSFILLSSGCVAIRADSDDKGASVIALGWGADSSAQLANVAVTGPGSLTNLQTGVSFDSANGEQQSYQAIQSLVALGAALAPMLAGGVPVAAVKPAAVQADPDTDAAEAPAASETETAQADYSSDGYGGSPGATGEGVYGRPSCSRCRAYKASHPGVQLINLDTASNRADMWAALRLRGFSGSNASLPVLITADAYTLSAR